MYSLLTMIFKFMIFTNNKKKIMNLTYVHTKWYGAHFFISDCRLFEKRPLTFNKKIIYRD